MKSTPHTCGSVSSWHTGSLSAPLPNSRDGRGNRLRQEWRELLTRVSGCAKDGHPVVDWRLTNPDWQSVALQGGRVNNTSTSIQLLANELAGAIGLEPEKGGLAHARRGAPQAPSAQRRH